MLHEICEAEHDLEREDGHRRSTQQDDGREAERKGQQQLTGMEAQPRGRGEGGIGVVDLMKSPEDGDPMVRAMPPVRDEIKQRDGRADASHQGIESALRRPMWWRAAQAATLKPQALQTTPEQHRVD